MQELDDNALLRDYLERNAEEPFAALVARHINKVYSVALRHTGNPHSAEEITQAVFVILAKKAGKLSRHPALSGWIYQTARLASVTFLRSESRRVRREQEACMQTALNENEPNAWPRIVPLLDTAMAGLNVADRQVLVLRFFDGKSIRETGTAIGVSEEAAKKRVSRAVEKLQKFFIKRGISSTAAGLAAVISANSVQAAPVALAKTVTAVAVAKGVTASASALTLIQGALKFMAWTQAKTAIVGAVVIGLAAYSVVQHQVEAGMRAHNESLQRQMAGLQAENDWLAVHARPSEQTPHLPAPATQFAAQPVTAPAPDVAATNLYGRLGDKLIKLSREQTDAFLKATGRTAASLLAAFRTSGDTALLTEAMTKFPNNPKVAFEASFDKDLSPAGQRQWLDNFEKSAPDNALANYLSALNYFNAGQIDQGVQDLAAAAGKPFDDYSSDRYQDDAEAFLAAGYPEADAKALSSTQLLLPQLSQIKQLSTDLIDLAGAYRQSGDAGSAQTVLQMAVSLGQGYVMPFGGESMVSQLFGIGVERNALKAMDPNAPYGNNGQTVQDTLNQLGQQNTALRQLIQQFTPLQQTMTDQDWIIYKDRWMAFGETAAEQWVVDKYTTH